MAVGALVGVLVTRSAAAQKTVAPDDGVLDFVHGHRVTAITPERTTTGTLIDHTADSITIEESWESVITLSRETVSAIALPEEPAQPPPVESSPAEVVQTPLVVVRTPSKLVSLAPQVTSSKPVVGRIVLEAGVVWLAIGAGLAGIGGLICIAPAAVAVGAPLAAVGGVISGVGASGMAVGGVMLAARSGHEGPPPASMEHSVGRVAPSVTVFAF